MKDCRRGFGFADFFILGINREIPRQIRLDKLFNDYSLGNLHPVHNRGQYCSPFRTAQMMPMPICGIISTIGRGAGPGTVCREGRNF